MEQYLVELFLPGRDEAALADAAARACTTSDELAEEGRQIRYLGAIFVPSDEICFLLYEAAAGDASNRARIAYERIVAARRLDGE